MKLVIIGICPYELCIKKCADGFVDSCWILELAFFWIEYAYLSNTKIFGLLILDDCIFLT